MHNGYVWVFSKEPSCVVALMVHSGVFSVIVAGLILSPLAHFRHDVFNTLPQPERNG